MSTTIQQLLQLQIKDRELREYHLEANDVPRLKKKNAARLEKFRVAQDRAATTLANLQSEIREMEADVEMAKEKIAVYRRQQMEVKDNEAFRTLESEIRTLQRHTTKQDDKTMEAMQRQETLQANADVATERLETAIKDVAHEEAVMDERQQELNQQIETLTASRNLISAEVPEDSLKLYDRTFQHVGDVALVTANGGTCAGCHMKLPPSTVVATKNTDNVCQCPYCGRMLYFDLG